MHLGDSARVAILEAVSIKLALMSMLCQNHGLACGVPRPPLVEQPSAKRKRSLRHRAPLPHRPRHANRKSRFQNIHSMPLKHSSRDCQIPMPKTLQLASIIPKVAQKRGVSNKKHDNNMCMLVKDDNKGPVEHKKWNIAKLHVQS